MLRVSRVLRTTARRLFSTEPKPVTVRELPKPAKEEKSIKPFPPSQTQLTKHKPVEDSLKELPSLLRHEAAVLDMDKQRERDLQIAQSFDEVPGPVSLQILGEIFSFLPRIITQLFASTVAYGMSSVGTVLLWSHNLPMYDRIFNKYGPVVRLRSPMGGDIVLVVRPEHAEAVFKQEGRLPVRQALDSVEKYRLSQRGMRHAGLYITSGPEWELLRAKVEEPLHHSAQQYCTELSTIAQNFSEKVRSMRNNQEEVPANFHLEIFKWSLESLALVTLERRLGLLADVFPSERTESGQLFSAMLGASNALRRCETGFQMWRFFNTPLWRRLAANCAIIDSIVEKQVQEVMHRVKAGSNVGPPTLLESLMATKGGHVDDAITIVLDTLLIGVNLTAHATAFLLYHLAKNQRVQRRLFEEVLTIMPLKNSQVSLDAIQKMEYLHACLKESLRLKPPVPMLTRVLPKDIALHGYKIPRGAYVLIANQKSAVSEDQFDEPRKFMPQRWLQQAGMPGEQGPHPFASLPFGHGPRACVGRALAELMIYLLTIQMIRNYRIEFHYGELQQAKQLIGMPDKPMKFRLEERTN